MLYPLTSIHQWYILEVTRMEVRKMNWERAREIGTHGGCGLLAMDIINKMGGTPLLRYDADGCAVHAAVKLNGEIIHLGDNDKFREVSVAELQRACREDFEPDRCNLEEGEIAQIVNLMFGEENEN